MAIGSSVSQSFNFSIFSFSFSSSSKQQLKYNMDSKQLGHVNTVPNQGETLARMCEEIRRRNLQATHFLVVFFRWGKDAAKGDKTKFRQLFFKFVTKREVVELAEDDFVHLQWKSPNSKTSSMYYTTSRFEIFSHFIFFSSFFLILFRMTIALMRRTSVNCPRKL